MDEDSKKNFTTVVLLPLPPPPLSLVYSVPSIHDSVIFRDGVYHVENDSPDLHISAARAAELAM